MFTHRARLLALLLVLFLPDFAWRPRWHGLPERGHKDKRATLGAESEPYPGWIVNVRSEAREKRFRIHKSLTRIIEAYDASLLPRLRQCGQLVARLSNESRPWHVMVARRCKHPLCPWCVVWNHYGRTLYRAERVASLNPARDPAPEVINLVFEVPPGLHALARTHPSVLPLVLTAARRTIAGAYKYEGDKKLTAEKRCWSELGAFVHLHAISDRGTPWPHWQPHFDIIIPAWRRHDGEMVRMRKSWPEPYRKTHRRYQEELRRALLPLVQSGPAHSIELQAYLLSDFPLMWHASRPPRGGGGGVIMRHEAAMHRIAYSCRSLVETGRMHLEQREGRDVLAYEPPQKHSENVLHIVPLGPALGQIRSLYPFLWGREARTSMGILKGKAYLDSVKLAGHEPVMEREGRHGREKVEAFYEPTPGGGLRKLDPRTFRPIYEHPGREEGSA